MASPLGLKNQDNLCYLNSILQMIHHIPGLRTKIFEVPDQDHDGLLTVLVESMQEVLNDLGKTGAASTTPVDPVKIAEALDALLTQLGVRSPMPEPQPVADLPGRQQEDISEVITLMLDKIDSKADDGCKKLLQVSVQKQIVSQANSELLSTKQLALNMLPLHLGRDVNSLSGAMRGYLSETFVECFEEFQIHAASLKKLPDILLLQLQRWHRVGGTALNKDNSKIEFCRELDMSEYIAGEGADLKYGLHSVLVHQGTSSFGHYWCCVRIGETWYKLNDEDVSVVDWKDVKAMSFGGHPPGGEYADTSGYVLCYVRESRARELLKGLKSKAEVAFEKRATIARDLPERAVCPTAEMQAAHDVLAEWYRQRQSGSKPRPHVRAKLLETAALHEVLKEKGFIPKEDFMDEDREFITLLPGKGASELEGLLLEIASATSRISDNKWHLQKWLDRFGFMLNKKCKQTDLMAILGDVLQEDSASLWGKVQEWALPGGAGGDIDEASKRFVEQKGGEQWESVCERLRKAEQYDSNDWIAGAVALSAVAYLQDRPVFLFEAPEGKLYSFRPPKSSSEKDLDCWGIMPIFLGRAGGRYYRALPNIDLQTCVLGRFDFYRYHLDFDIVDRILAKLCEMTVLASAFLLEAPRSTSDSNFKLKVISKRHVEYHFEMLAMAWIAFFKEGFIPYFLLRQDLSSHDDLEEAVEEFNRVVRDLLGGWKKDSVLTGRGVRTKDYLINVVKRKLRLDDYLVCECSFPHETCILRSRVLDGSFDEKCIMEDVRSLHCDEHPDPRLVLFVEESRFVCKFWERWQLSTELSQLCPVCVQISSVDNSTLHDTLKADKMFFLPDGEDYYELRETSICTFEELEEPWPVNAETADSVTLCKEFCSPRRWSNDSYQHIVVWNQNKDNSCMTSIAADLMHREEVVIVICGKVQGKETKHGHELFLNDAAMEMFGVERIEIACSKNKLIDRTFSSRDNGIRFKKSDKIRVKQVLQFVKDLCQLSGVSEDKLFIVTLTRSVREGTSIRTWGGLLPTVLLCPFLSNAVMSYQQLHLALSCVCGVVKAPRQKEPMIVIRKMAMELVFRMITAVKSGEESALSQSLSRPQPRPANKLSSPYNKARKSVQMDSDEREMLLLQQQQSPQSKAAGKGKLAAGGYAADKRRREVEADLQETEQAERKRRQLHPQQQPRSEMQREPVQHVASPKKSHGVHEHACPGLAMPQTRAEQEDADKAMAMQLQAEIDEEERGRQRQAQMAVQQQEGRGARVPGPQEAGAREASQDLELASAEPEAGASQKRCKPCSIM